MVILHVATFEGVQEVGDRRVLRRNRDLHTTLSHHAIGVTEPQLRCKNHLCAGPMRMQRSSATSATTTDNQDIRRVVWGQINTLGDGTVAFEKRG